MCGRDGGGPLREIGDGGVVHEVGRETWAAWVAVKYQYRVVLKFKIKNSGQSEYR
jgi:hypothetical protein